MGARMEDETDSTSDVAPSGSLTQRIHAVYGALPKSERKAADLVLDRPGELAVWAANELAERASVSNATVSRLVRRLGYGSYEEARRASRAMRAQGSPLYLAGGDGRGREASGLAQLMAADMAAVEMSLSMLNPLTISAVAERAATARRVVLAGFRNSYLVAEYGQIALGQLRPDVSLLNAPGQTVAERMAGLGKGDLALLVGLRRRPRGFHDMARSLAATGADVALLADRSIREAPAAARWTFLCTVETPQLIDSYAGAMSVMRALAVATMRRLGPEGRRHLERIESLHEALDELE